VSVFLRSYRVASPFAKPRDESAQGSQIAGEPLYAIAVAYRAHVGDGHDFWGGSLDTTLGKMYPSSFSFKTPKTHFLGFSLMLNLRRFMNVAAKFAIRSQA
jgi:hypothetical protein